MFALFLLLISAARPTWGKKIISITTYGRDIIFIIDVSKSMLASDVSPSRLEHAKWFMRELLNQCYGDRFAIVAFAGKAFLQCPLTSDKVSLVQMINELSPEQIPLGGTNIQEALQTALKSFDAAEGANRAIVLISDGEELYGSVASILSELKERKIPIFSIGLGNPNQKTPITIKDDKGRTNFLRDSKGEIVSTRLNEDLLKKIAIATGGVYVRSTSTDSGLENIVSAIKDLSSEKLSSKESYRPIERFQLPLFVALVLLFCRLAISERRKVFTILFLLSLVYTNVFSDNQLPLPEKKADSTEIKRNSADLLKQKKLLPYELYNYALEKQKSKQVEEAEKLYFDVISSVDADSDTVLRAYQNLGVIEHQKGRNLLKSNPQSALESFYEARKFYKEAMRSKSSKIQFENIANNQQLLINDIEAAKKVIEQQKQQQKNSEEAREEMKKALDENQKSEKSPQNKEQKEKTIDQNQKAQNALNKVRNQIPDEENQRKEQVERAIEEMKKAQKEQEKQDFSKAKEHIKNAINQFSKADEKKQESENKSPNEEKNKDNLNAEQNRKQGEDNSNQNKNLDPQMAETILDLINKDENKLREELQKREIENFRIKEVEKDW
ncbi:MAG TPA: VWA domain-containing protein [Victivallales bacterium]|nr:VWA domain-containing protein [Victivallales bacterium]